MRSIAAMLAAACLALGLSACGGGDKQLPKQHKAGQGDQLGHELAENARLENEYNRRRSGQAQREGEEAGEVIRERQAGQNANKIEREASEAP